MTENIKYNSKGNPDRISVSREEFNLPLNYMNGNIVRNKLLTKKKCQCTFIPDLYKCRENADLELIFKNNKSSKVHKFVLASNSDKILNLIYKNDESELKFEEFGVICSLGAPKSLGSTRIHSLSLPNRKPPSVKTEAQISSSSLYPSSVSLDNKPILELRIFQDYSESSCEILIKLCYHQKVDFTQYRLEEILESLNIAKKFGMAYVEDEIMAYLNGTTITKNNFHHLNILYDNENNDSYLLQQSLESFRKNQNDLDFKVEEFEVISGENPSALSEVKHGPINSIKDCTYHRIGSNDGIVIKLSKVFSINYIKMRLFDEKLSAYSYNIEVSEDSKNWKPVFGHKKYQCRSWQLIYFPQISIQFIKIVGTKSHDMIECDYFEISSIEIFRTKNPMQMKNDVLYPNQDMAKISRGAILLRGINTSVIF
jgi:hypothetical protein